MRYMGLPSGAPCQRDSQAAPHDVAVFPQVAAFDLVALALARVQLLDQILADRRVVGVNVSGQRERAEFLGA